MSLDLRNASLCYFCDYLLTSWLAKGLASRLVNGIASRLVRGLVRGRGIEEKGHFQPSIAVAWVDY